MIEARTQTLITVQDFLRQITLALEEASTTSRLDAEILLAHGLNKSRPGLIIAACDTLSEQQLLLVNPLIERRKRGEPLAYICGEKEFWSHALQVGPGVLIPRPDSEILVEKVLQQVICSDRSRPLRILDIGTGSGNLIIALAIELSQASFVAIEVSEPALKYAQGNFFHYGLARRVQVERFDFMRDDSQALEPPYDLIISNPPYISDEDLAKLDRGISQFEPRLALAGGRDGLDFYRRVAEVTPGLLVGGGWLGVEIGEDQAGRVSALLERNGFLIRGVYQDYSGLDRAVLAQLAK